MTDAKNQTTLYGYFIDDNLKQVSYSNAVVATPGVSFTYDTNYDRITSMVDGTGTNIYSYYTVSGGSLGRGMCRPCPTRLWAASDLQLRCAGPDHNRAINSVSQQIAFDALNRVSAITNVLGKFSNAYVGGTALITTNFAPFGKKTIFSYLSVTNDERLKTILNQKTNSVTFRNSITIMMRLGNITNWTQQADTTTTNVQVMQYDPVNQLLSDTVHSNTVAGAILKQYAYGYDAGGNRTTEQIGTGTGVSVAVSQITYNNDNQVTSRSVASGQCCLPGA